MSNLKRFLALTLAVMMVVGGMSLNVSALKATDLDKDIVAKYPLISYAVDILSDLEVVRGVAETKGADGVVASIEFGGEQNVTREQFALFTARITTAHPEYFIVGNVVQNPTSFTDLVDPTYFAAIDYCEQQGIVNGKAEGVYDPKGIVTLQEAVKMLVSSLNYTGLSYPVGYLEKAAEKDVAILGKNAPFTMADLKPSDSLTRYDMVMLLYNYLLSGKYELEAVRNEITGQITYNPVIKPILGMFGFTKIQGYITGVDGWASSITIPDPLTNPNGIDDAARLITMDGHIMSPVAGTLTTANLNDLEVSWPTTVGTRDTVSGLTVYSTGYAQQTFIKENIGFGEYGYEYLLGLKVEFYIDQSGNVNDRFNFWKGLVIPPRLIGNKIEISPEACDSAYTHTDGTGTDINAVQSLSLPVTEGATAPALKYVLTDVNKADMASFNLYMFNAKEARMAYSNSAGNSFNYGAQTDNALKSLAKSALKTNSNNYRLEYIDNGVHANGYHEWYYVFRPYQVGVRAADKNGIRFTQKVSGLEDDGDGDGEVGQKMGNGKINKDYAELAAADWAVGEAYFFTEYGAKFDIYGKLVKTAGAEANFKGGSRIGFDKLEAARVYKSFDFTNSLSKAIAAFDVGKFNANSSVYTLFAEDKKDGATLIARETKSGAPVYAESQYFVLLDVSDRRYVSVIDYDHGLTGLAYSAHVFDPAINGVREIAIWNVNDYSTGVDELKYSIGDPLRVVKSVYGFYHAYTTEIPPNNDAADGTKNSNFVWGGDKEYFEYDKAFAPVGITTLNVNMLNINGWRAYVNSSTNIVVYCDNPTLTADHGKAAKWTGNSAGLKKLEDIFAAKSNFSELVVVRFESTRAAYVFLKTDAPLAPPATPVTGYGMLTSLIDAYEEPYQAAKAMGFTSTTAFGEMKVADLFNSNNLKLGALIKTGVTTKSIDGTVYTVISGLVDGTLTGLYSDTDAAKVAAFNALTTVNTKWIKEDTTLDTNVVVSIGQIIDYGAGGFIELKTGPAATDIDDIALNGFNNFNIFVKYTDKDAKTTIKNDRDADGYHDYFPLSDPSFLNLRTAVASNAYAIVYKNADGAILGVTVLVDYDSVSGKDATDAYKWSK